MSNVQTPVALDHTVGTITRGANPDPITCPVTVLHEGEASLLRRYQHALKNLNLDPDLFCAACYDGRRESKSAVEINPQQIVIVCGCRMLFYQGASPAVAVPLPEVSSGASFMDLVLPTTPEIPLPKPYADLFQRYKNFLTKYRLREALWCRTCFTGGRLHGTHAQVLPLDVRIECRHRRLTAHGFAQAQ